MPNKNVAIIFGAPAVRFALQENRRSQSSKTKQCKIAKSAHTEYPNCHHQYIHQQMLVLV